MMWKEGVMGVFREEGVMGDRVLGGGCWGDGVMDNTSEPTKI